MKLKIKQVFPLEKLLTFNKRKINMVMNNNNNNKFQICFFQKHTNYQALLGGGQKKSPMIKVIK